MPNKPVKLISRLGVKSQKTNMKAGEYGFYTDTRAGVVGDDSANPPEILTTKSRGEYDFSSADKVTFSSLVISSLNGTPIEDIIEKVDSAYNTDTNVLYNQLPNGISVVVKSSTIADPPSLPGARDVYLVPNNATGVWLNKAGLLAQKSGTEWKFATAPVRTLIGIADTGGMLIQTNTGWANFFASNDEHLAHNVTDRPATPAGVYSMLQQYIGGGSDNGNSGIAAKYTASETPPPSPSLKDYWYDTITQSLFIWAYNGNSYSWLNISGQDSSDGGGIDNTNADYVLPISWQYGTDNFSFETWTDDQRYSWRDFNGTGITNAVAGDDTLEVEDTFGVKINETYAIQDVNGTFVQSVDVISVLTPTRIRVRNDLGVSLSAASRATLVRTTFEVGSRYSVVSNKDVFFTKFLSNLDPTAKSNFVIRRSSLGLGIFAVKYRAKGNSAWTDLDLKRVVTIGTDNRDEYYDIPVGGAIQFWIAFASDGGVKETVFHLATFPKAQSVDANRVFMPVNVAPADQAVSVSTTPTLVGSLYRSLYGLAQNGAEFRIATDKKMSNVVVSSSTDFLASWVRIPGATAASKALTFLNNRKAIVVGDAGSVRITTDGGNTYTAGTPATSVNLTSIAYDGARIHVAGVSGSLQYSDDQGVTFLAASSTDNFAGAFSGIASCPGGIVVAVGASGEITRSVNSGVIYSKISADNAYTGAFTAISSDSSGNIVIVGANGEIQTSGNRGQTFVHRTNAGNYAGTFNAVDMDDLGNVVIVGANGEIQVSADYGATWVKIAADNGYTGTFYGVYVYDIYAIAVGSGGEIQSSKTRGRSWTKRIAANSEAGNFRAVAVTPDNYALIVGDGGITQKPLTLTASTSYSVPSGSDLLGVNKVYYWDVRYQDAAGFWSDRSLPTIFATQATLSSVRQPSNLSPADNFGSASTTPTLQTSTFATTGSADTHTKSQWQIATDAQFSNIVYDSGDSNSLLTLVLPTVSALTSGAKYFWRVRQKGTALGYSPYSMATSFTAISKPNTPTLVAPADKANLVIGSNVTFTSSAFSSPVAGDALAAAVFMIAEDIGFTKIIFQKSVSTVSTTVDTSTLGLSANKAYYVRVSHRGTLSGEASSFSSVNALNGANPPPTGEVVYIGNPFVQRSFTFTVPENVSTISAVLVGAGGGPLLANPGGETNPGFFAFKNYGGSGGGLTWVNDIPVRPGQQITVVINRPGYSSGAVYSAQFQAFSFPSQITTNDGNTFEGISNSNSGSMNGGASYISIDGGSVFAQGGGYTFSSNGSITPYAGIGGTSQVNLTFPGLISGGGNGGLAGIFAGSGGGAGGYSGNGGDGGYALPSATGADGQLSGTFVKYGQAGSGGGGGGGFITNLDGSGNRNAYGFAGGGVGIRGKGASGAASSTYQQGRSGSGGVESQLNDHAYSNTVLSYGQAQNFYGGNNSSFDMYTENKNWLPGAGGKFGGGGCFSSSYRDFSTGGVGAVRIIWGPSRSFPDNAA